MIWIKITVNPDDIATPKDTFICLFGDFAYFEDESFKLNAEGIKILHDVIKIDYIIFWCELLV